MRGPNDRKKHLATKVTKDVYLESRKRSLSAAERRLLSAKAKALRSQEKSPRKVALLAGGVVAALWLATILASDSPWSVITLFWVVVGTGIGVWVWRDARRDSKYAVAMARRLESALVRDEANVFDFKARSFVEFQEIEDEGACYAFDLGDGVMAFVAGQEFYPEARFPSLDFSIVYPLDADGYEVDVLIEKRGSKADPVRKLAAKVKRDYVIPEHLEALEGQLSELESLLSRYRGE